MDNMLKNDCWKIKMVLWFITKDAAYHVSAVYNLSYLKHGGL